MVLCFLVPLAARVWFEERSNNDTEDGERMKYDIGWMTLGFTVAYANVLGKKATQSYTHRSFSAVWGVLALFFGFLYISFLSENTVRQDDWRTGMTNVKQDLPIRIFCRILFSMPDGYRGKGICSDSF